MTPSLTSRLITGAVLAVGLILAGPDAAHAAADCDLSELGRDGTASHGTQVSIGGKIFRCNDGAWSML